MSPKTRRRLDFAGETTRWLMLAGLAASTLAQWRGLGVVSQKTETTANAVSVVVQDNVRDSKLKVPERLGRLEQDMVEVKRILAVKPTRSRSAALADSGASRGPKGLPGAITGAVGGFFRWIRGG